MTSVDVKFDLWPKQLEALESKAQLIVYGGAAGSGKSHLARVASIVAAVLIPGIQVYLFRRHYADLISNHMEGPTGFHAMLQALVEHRYVEIVDCEIRFKNGSKVFLRHCQHEKDVYNYQGPEFHFLIVEEATQFTEFQLRFLFSRGRIPDSLKIPDNMCGMWPRILLPTNPGGLSHSYIKSNYIDGHEDGKIWKQDEKDGGRTCQFISARLTDNPSINPNEYRAALLGLKRPELIDAMLNGKWDIPLGAFFPEADERRHIISGYIPSPSLLTFRTFDWGSGAPAAVQWWQVQDGSQRVKSNVGSESECITLPRESLVCFREWYICNPLDTSQGIALSNHQMCEGILERTPQTEKIYGTITDSKPFQAQGALTIAEEFNKYGVPLTKGDTSPGSRIQGWQQLRSRLIGINGIPYVYFTTNCTHTWRCLTEIQTDPKKVEDLDTQGEDHLIDAVGLACKARPFVTEEKKNATTKYVTEASFNEVLANHLRYKRFESSVRR